MKWHTRKPEISCSRPLMSALPPSAVIVCSPTETPRNITTSLTACTLQATHRYFWKKVRMRWLLPTVFLYFLVLLFFSHNSQYPKTLCQSCRGWAAVHIIPWPANLAHSLSEAHFTCGMQRWVAEICICCMSSPLGQPKSPKHYSLRRRSSTTPWLNKVVSLSVFLALAIREVSKTEVQQPAELDLGPHSHKWMAHGPPLHKPLPVLRPMFLLPLPLSTLRLVVAQLPRHFRATLTRHHHSSGSPVVLLKEPCAKEYWWPSAERVGESYSRSNSKRDA